VLYAQSVCRHLRPQIGQPLARDLAIEQDQLLHVPLQFAGAIEADRRDAQTFLVDVGVAAVGEIGVVRAIGRPGEGQFAGPRTNGRRRLVAADAGRRQAMAAPCPIAAIASGQSPGLGRWKADPQRRRPCFGC